MARDLDDRMLDDPVIELLGMLIESHNEVLHAVASRLDDHADVPVPWLGVLIRLSRSPDQRLRMTELARDMTMSNSGLTRLIDRVEAAGHVARESCPGDRRGLLAVLTDEGRDLLARILPGHVADLHAVFDDCLTAEEVTLLVDLLRRVRNHVRTADID